MKATQHKCKVCGEGANTYFMNDLGGIVAPFRYYVHEECREAGN